MTMAETFALIEAAAVKGERCPMNEPFGPLLSTLVSELVSRGQIRVQISGKNWRTATLLVGPHRGKRTKPDPSGSKVNRVVEAAHVRTSRRAGPSAPRDFSKGC